MIANKIRSMRPGEGVCLNDKNGARFLFSIIMPGHYFAADLKKNIRVWTKDLAVVESIINEKEVVQ